MHHGKKQASRDVDLPCLPVFGSSRPSVHSATSSAVMGSSALPSPVSLDTRTPVRYGPGQGQGQGYLRTSAPTTSAATAAPQQAWVHDSASPEVFTSRATPSTGYQTITPLAGPTSYAPPASTGAPPVPPHAAAAAPTRSWLGPGTLDEPGDSVFAVSALTNTSTSSAVSRVPQAVPVGQAVPAARPMVPPPALSAAYSSQQVGDLSLEAIDDNIASLMGVMNEVYSATERQKQESAVKARQFEEKQKHIVGLLQRLTATPTATPNSSVNTLSPTRRSPTVRSPSGSPGIRRTATLSPPRPSTSHQDGQVAGRLTQPARPGLMAVQRQRSLSQPAKPSSPEVGEEEGEHGRLSKKCHLLATELVSSVQKTQTLQAQLKESGDEVSAREMENTRLRHEVAGLRTRVSDLEARRTASPPAEKPVAVQMAKRTSPVRGLPAGQAARQAAPNTQQRSGLVRATAIIVDEPLPSKTEAVAVDAHMRVQLRDALIDKARMEEELRHTKEQLAESVTRESRRAVEMSKWGSEGRVTPVPAAPTAVKGKGKGKGPSLESVEHILQSDELHGKTANPQVVSLMLEEQHSRAQIVLDHALAWRQRCVHVSSKLADHITHAKMIQAERDSLRVSLQKAPPPPQPQPLPPPPAVHHQHQHQQTPCQDTTTTATSPFASLAVAPPQAQQKLYTQEDVDMLKQDWAEKIADLEATVHTHMQEQDEASSQTLDEHMRVKDERIRQLEAQVEEARAEQAASPSPSGTTEALLLSEQVTSFNKERLRLQEKVIDLETKLFLVSSTQPADDDDVNLDATIPADPLQAQLTTVSSARRLHEVLCATCKVSLQNDREMSRFLQLALDGRTAQTYDDIMQELERLRVDEVQMKERVSDLESDNYELECVKESAETACEEARQRIAALETSRDAWWRECSSILRQMAERRREASESLKELEDLRLEVQALRAENVRLNGSLTSPGASPSPQRSLLAEQLSDLQKEKANLEDMLQSAFAESTAEVESLRSRLESATAGSEAEIQRLREENALLVRRASGGGKQGDQASVGSGQTRRPSGSSQVQSGKGGSQRQASAPVTPRASKQHRQQQPRTPPQRKPQLPVEATRAHLKKLHDAEKKHTKEASTPDVDVNASHSPTTSYAIPSPRGRRISLSGSMRSKGDDERLPPPTSIVSPRRGSSHERSRSPMPVEIDRMSPVIRVPSGGATTPPRRSLVRNALPSPIRGNKIGRQDLLSGGTDILDSPQGDELAVILDAAGSPLSDGGEGLVTMLRDERLSHAASADPADPVTTVNIMLNVAPSPTGDPAAPQGQPAQEADEASSSSASSPVQRGLSVEAKEIVEEVEQEIGSILQEIRSREISVSQKERLGMQGEAVLRRREEDIRWRERALFVEKQVQVLAQRMETSPFGRAGSDELENLRKFVDRHVSASTEEGVFAIINPELRDIIAEASQPRPQQEAVVSPVVPPVSPPSQHSGASPQLGLLGVLQALSPDIAARGGASPAGGGFGDVDRGMVRQLIRDLRGESQGRRNSSESSYTTSSSSSSSASRSHGRSYSTTTGTGTSSSSSSSSVSDGDDDEEALTRAAHFIRRKTASRGVKASQQQRVSIQGVVSTVPAVETHPPQTAAEALAGGRVAEPSRGSLKKKRSTSGSRKNAYFAVSVKT